MQFRGWMGGWIDEMSRVAQERENVNDRHMNESKKFYENNPREDNRKERVKDGTRRDEKVYNSLYTARGPWYEYVLALQSPFPSTSSLIVRAS